MHENWWKEKTIQVKMEYFDSTLRCLEPVKEPSRSGFTDDKIAKLTQSRYYTKSSVGYCCRLYELGMGLIDLGVLFNGIDKVSWLLANKVDPVYVTEVWIGCGRNIITALEYIKDSPQDVKFW